jgi:hypothetical protein
VIASPLDAAWTTSACVPGANLVGWSRLGGSGEKKFSLAGGSTTKSFGFV